MTRRDNPDPKGRQVEKMRYRSRRIAPIDEIVLCDEEGEVCRYGVVHKQLIGSLHFRRVLSDEEQPVIDVTLPRIAWMERPDV